MIGRVVGVVLAFVTFWAIGLTVGNEHPGAAGILMLVCCSAAYVISVRFSERLPAFAPYIVVALVHLVGKARRDEIDFVAIDDGTRPLLLPALIFAVLSSATRPWSSTTRWLLAALCCSWIGDLTLRWFLVGLGAFLCAHLCFLVTMTKTWVPPSLRPVGGLVVVWWIGLLAVLHEQLGSLLVPVGIYGAVLGAMAVVASRGGAVAFVGAVCFVASDTLLAFRLFTPGASSRAADVVTMGLYCVAQGLLVLALQRATPAPATT